MAEDKVLVSFDVVFLFTNVPIGGPIKIIREMLHHDEDLVMHTPLSPDRIGELLGLCLGSTYFSYNTKFFKQSEGATMGSPVSAVVANLYMEFFEEVALSSAPGDQGYGSGTWMIRAA